MGFFAVKGAGALSAPIPHAGDAAVIAVLSYIAALCCASIQDIRTKEVSDWFHIIIGVTAFIGFNRANLSAVHH